MAWTFLKIIQITESANIVAVSATWTDLVDTTKKFTFKKERIDPNSTGAKAQFKIDANAAKGLWEAEQSMTASEQTLLTQMNA